MSGNSQITFLCLASEFKGKDLMIEAHRQGCRVILIAKEKWVNEPWPRESIDEIYFMPDLSNAQYVINAVSYLYRTRQIDQIIPLDEYDVEMAAIVREHLRMPGMGHSAARYFRDKLAMRTRAHEAGIPVPSFVGVLNHEQIHQFTQQYPAPWMLKPRTWAGAVGMKKMHSAEELWPQLDAMGDEQSAYLLERFVPGDVFHVDSIVNDGEVVFSIVHKYAKPPLNVSHDGGVFMTRTLERDSADAAALRKLNIELLKALGMERGITHAEFIKGQDGKFYFLEVAARVGGANIADLIEAATGLNPWVEWVRMEIAHVRGVPYQLPPLREDYAGIVISLARQEFPDTVAYNDPEVVWRMHKKFHVGLIVASPSAERVLELLNNYGQRITQDFSTVAQYWDRPPQ